MVKKTLRDELRDDFSFLKGDVLGILLYGSHLGKGETKGSDIDICIVVGKRNGTKILQRVWHNIDVYKKNYDVKLFEELPLHLRIEIIENHEIIYAKDKAGLFEYFYKFRKLWKDQRYRNTVGKEEILRML